MAGDIVDFLYFRAVRDSLAGRQWRTPVRGTVWLSLTLDLALTDQRVVFAGETFELETLKEVRVEEFRENDPTNEPFSL